MKNLKILGRLCIVVFALTFMYCPSFGQERTSKIDKKDLKEFIKTLSSIQFAGRGIDNNGQIKTQEYIVNRFNALHLAPFSSDGYLETFKVNQYSRGEVYLKTQNQKILRDFDRIIYGHIVQENEEKEWEVVYGGFGSEKELKQIEVEGRVVLVIDPKEEYACMRILQDRKAAGMILCIYDMKRFDYNKITKKEMLIYKRCAIAERDDIQESDSLDVESDEDNYSFFSVFAHGTEVKNIMGMSKQKLILLANEKKIDEAPIARVTIKTTINENTYETANVIGLIKGESDTSIIISAHYDHLGQVGKIYYPGADDNASGIAAMLELAEEFAQYEHLPYSMVFLATTAEEGGLIGSLYHTAQSGFDPEKVLCDINIDMISRCDEKLTDCKYLYCIGNDKSKMLDSIVRQADALFPSCSFDYSENKSDHLSRSDSYYFDKKGIPTLLFFTGLHKDYHKPTDTMEKINFDILENRVRLIAVVVQLLQSL